MTVLPASVMLIGLFGLLVVAFATTRMAVLERKVRRSLSLPPVPQRFVRSTV